MIAEILSEFEFKNTYQLKEGLNDPSNLVVDDPGSNPVKIDDEREGRKET